MGNKNYKINVTPESAKSFKVVNESNIIFFKKAHPLAQMPKKADPGSACFDLYSIEEVTIEPGQIKLINTGLIWEPSMENVEMQIRPRSGLAYKHGITVLNSPGTIDSSYRDEIKVMLINHGDKAYTIEEGERCAQGKLEFVEPFTFEQTDKVGKTQRDGGLGSSGRF